MGKPVQVISVYRAWPVPIGVHREVSWFMDTLFPGKTSIIIPI